MKRLIQTLAFWASITLTVAFAILIGMELQRSGKVPAFEACGLGISIICMSLSCWFMVGGGQTESHTGPTKAPPRNLKPGVTEHDS